LHHERLPQQHPAVDMRRGMIAAQLDRNGRVETDDAHGMRVALNRDLAALDQGGRAAY